MIGIRVLQNSDICNESLSAMAPNAESPVQTQMPIPVPSGAFGKRNSFISRRHVGCRRVFVQTDTGSVLGIELDRADSVQTVKKKMQSMLNVPTEQTALVFGDMVLKNDLSELRNYAPLLLTRGLQRSLSTPCFLPIPESYTQVDQSQPLEVVGGLRCPKIQYLIKEMVKAMECGIEPVSVSGGLGGAYYFRNTRGESIAMVKPTDEEPFAPNNPKGLIGKMLGQPGLKRAVRIGETGIREVAAYLLDHEHFAGVPPTVLIKARHEVFHVNNATPAFKGLSKMLPVAKIASCQEFVPHDFDASELGAPRFSVSSVHRIGILDVRTFNTDRHGGNILVRTLAGNDVKGQHNHCTIQLNEPLELIPIDHGLCLPETFEDPYFEWLHWPQASLPFSDDELDYICRLDMTKDVEMLREELPMLREACLRMLTLSTTFLKRAANAGLCLAEIGGMMSRDSCGMEETSELELLCLQAKLEVDRELSSARLSDNENVSELFIPEELTEEQFQFYMDQEEEFPVNKEVNATYDIGSKEVHGANGSQCKAAGGGLLYTNSRNEPLENPSVSTVHSASLVTSAAVSPANGRRPCIFINNTLDSKRSNQQLSSSMNTSSPRSLSGIRGNMGILHEIPCTKEEEPALGVQKNSGSMKETSPRAQSLRSISFSYHRQRCPDHLLLKKNFNRQGVSVSEVRGKAYTMAGSSHILLGDLTEEEWILFMDFFEELLQEALVNWQSNKSSHRQRLGVSCQF